LDAYDISAWWDYGLEAGKSFEPQIMEELASTGLVCPIWCTASVNSDWVIREASFGLDNGKLLPARLQEAVLPARFESIQCQDLVGWNGTAESYQLTAFASSIVERLGRPLRPAADKLRALRTLSVLTPLGGEESPNPVVSRLRVERATQMSLGGSVMDLFWNGERLGDVRMGNTIELTAPPGEGELQVGMRHAIGREMSFTEPVQLTLAAGRTTYVRLKLEANLFGFPAINFWLDASPIAQTRGWIRSA